VIFYIRELNGKIMVENVNGTWAEVKAEQGALGPPRESLLLT